MTDEDIIKALECCLEFKCKECPCWAEEVDACCYGINEDVLLDLIKRQRAEIERLMHNIEAMAQTMPNMAKAERAEAIKEFAERLKEESSFETDVSLGYGRPCYENAVPIIAIDNLVKEMVGEEE